MIRAKLPLVAATALVVAACGGTEDPSEQTGDQADPATEEPGDIAGSVTMWIPPIAGDRERAYWDDTIAEFNSEYPDIDVQVEVIPWESRDERLTTAVAGNTTPDVTYVLPRDIPRFVELGVLRDVESLVADDRDDFFDSALDGLSWDGTLYGVPVLMAITTTVLNKEIFEELGITEYPETWDDVRELAPLIHDAGYFVTQYDAAPTMTLNGSFYPLLWQAGGDILNEDQSAAAFNGPEGLRALEFAKWLVDNEYTPRDALTTDLPVETGPIGQGKVAMLFARSTNSLENNGMSPEDMVVVPPIGDSESISFGTVGGYVHFNTSEQPEAVDAWIAWITRPDELRRFLPERSMLSPRASVTGLYSDNDVMAAQEQEAIVGRTTVGLVHPAATEIMDLIKPHLQAALLGDVEPQAALDAAAAEVDALLARQ